MLMLWLRVRFVPVALLLPGARCDYNHNNDYDYVVITSEIRTSGSSSSRCMVCPLYCSLWSHYVHYVSYQWPFFYQVHCVPILFWIIIMISTSYLSVMIITTIMIVWLWSQHNDAELKRVGYDYAYDYGYDYAYDYDYEHGCDYDYAYAYDDCKLMIAARRCRAQTCRRRLLIRRHGVRRDQGALRSATSRKRSP